MKKQCSSCKLTKPFEDFHRSSTTKTGRQSKCKLCNIKSTRAWQEANPDKFEEYWKARYPRHYLLRKSRTYGITVEEVEALLLSTNGECTICRTDKKSFT